MDSPPVFSPPDDEDPKSRLVDKIHKRAGNDKIYIALGCTLFALAISCFLFPLAVVLDVVSLLCVVASWFSKRTPTPAWIILGVLLAVWNLLRIFTLLLLLLSDFA